MRRGARLWVFGIGVLMAVLALVGCENENQPSPTTHTLPSPTTHTVSFESNGGSAVDSQTVDDGGLVSEPAAPTKAGHGFAGWYADAALSDTWDFTTDAVTGAMTLYANWTPNKSWGVISGMSPADGATTTDTTPELSWDVVAGVDHYEVQAADTEAGVPQATGLNADENRFEYPTPLSVGDALFWRVRAVDGDGQAGMWSDVFELTVVLRVGSTGPAGGIVFYDKGSYSDGWRYLEAWTTDEAGDYQWKTSNTPTGGTSPSIGLGYANTYTAMAGSAHPAAEVCRNATHGGYTDWFLPSKDELNQLYLQRSAVGGFSGNFSHWSSSEDGDDKAWFHRFANNDQNDRRKDGSCLVRAVRRF